MRKALFIAILIVPLLAGAKKPLDHDAFEAWEKVKNYAISNDGTWEAYGIIPGDLDETLHLRSKGGKEIVIDRGYNPRFSADSKWAFALIKPTVQETREAKIKKAKDKEPADSLAIINLSTGSVERIAKVKSFIIGKDGGDWIAYSSLDTAYAKQKHLDDKKCGKPLVVRTFDGKISKLVKWVDSFVFPNDGSKLAMTIVKPEKDTLATNGVAVMLFPDTAYYLIDHDKKFYGKPVFNEEGSLLAFTAGNDSVASGTKRLRLYTSNLQHPLHSLQEYNIFVAPKKGKNFRKPNTNDSQLDGEKLKEWERRMNISACDTLFINQYSVPKFSYNGKRLVIGVGKYIAPDDTTIYDFETAKLDIWRWDAPFTPPQENKLLSEIQKNTMPVVIDIATGNWKLITNEELADVTPPDRWDGDWALVADPTEFMVERQWNYLAKTNLSVVNVNSGEKKFIGALPYEDVMLSPADKYVIWYENRNFYAYDIASAETVCLTKDFPYLIWDEDDDHPMAKPNYGIAGWSANDEIIFINDKYDIWGFDPKGVKSPFSLTNEEGRKTNRRYRYINTDPVNHRFLSTGDLLLYRVFDYATKCNGFATGKYEGKAQNPKLQILEGASFSQLLKAKNADSFSWQRASFEIAPNIWYSSSLNFGKATQISDSNPQMKDYSWGTAQLFKWHAYDGKEAEGVLYLPEDFSPDKEYPMLAVFYETGAQDLYTHYAMEPSWSWVNYPFYVSRGYVVFVPDIYYTPGIPGESAYNYVCSGVEAVCDTYPNIDRKRIGIDGQSWGGYQTAYLVTRTDMFACAGSGAPVANMTSAFGGIRWESGNSRQTQYEQGQSRIGANLWEAPELYILNSPVFRADKCETPLLIMHNDADGAVPWYQGIEMFMALRRLGKPVWMLQYNGEAHNLKERRNRKDITVRLQQFFDHYLKGAPMPKWMSEGVPAIRKGQEMGY